MGIAVPGLRQVGLGSNHLLMLPPPPSPGRSLLCLCWSVYLNGAEPHISWTWLLGKGQPLGANGGHTWTLGTTSAWHPVRYTGT